MTEVLGAALLSTVASIQNAHLQTIKAGLWPQSVTWLIFLSGRLLGGEMSTEQRLRLPPLADCVTARSCWYNVEYDDDDAPLIRETKLLSDQEDDLVSIRSGPWSVTDARKPLC